VLIEQPQMSQQDLPQFFEFSSKPKEIPSFTTIKIGLAMILLTNCRVDVKQQSLKIEKYLLIFITNKYVYIKYYGKCEVIPRVNQ
jgi:hypothetical protein